MTTHARPDKATYEYAHQAYLEELELRIKAQMELVEAHRERDEAKAALKREMARWDSIAEDAKGD